MNLFFDLFRNPNMGDGGSWTEANWPPHTFEKKEFLTLDINTTEIGYGPRAKQCAFWKMYLPELLAATCKSIPIKSKAEFELIPKQSLQVGSFFLPRRELGI